MRKQTIDQIKDAVYTLENNFLNPWVPGVPEEPMTIEAALEYVEICFNEQMDSDSDKDRSVRFDGRDNILAEMKRQIISNENIILKDGSKEKSK